jgi:indolepyruvate ferredoxin oxidoreductase beta subunit
MIGREDKMKEVNILISGVGGQGNVLLERIIGISAIKEGHPVRAADTFGAAQRGGSVLSHLRMGSEVHSSLVPQGRCHILLGLEPGEALNTAIKFLSKNALVIVNTFSIFPPKVKVGEWSYPPAEKILILLRELTSNVIELDATALARQATGNERAMNIVLLGVLIGVAILPIGPDTVRSVIEETTGKFAQVSIQAFEAGFKIGQQRQTLGRLGFEDS